MTRRSLVLVVVLQTLLGSALLAQRKPDAPSLQDGRRARTEAGVAELARQLEELHSDMTLLFFCRWHGQGRRRQAFSPDPSGLSNAISAKVVQNLREGGCDADTLKIVQSTDFTEEEQRSLKRLAVNDEAAALVQAQTRVRSDYMVTVDLHPVAGGAGKVQAVLTIKDSYSGNLIGQDTRNLTGGAGTRATNRYAEWIAAATGKKLGSYFGKLFDGSFPREVRVLDIDDEGIDDLIFGLREIDHYSELSRRKRQRMVGDPTGGDGRQGVRFPVRFPGSAYGLYRQIRKVAKAAGLRTTRIDLTEKTLVLAVSKIRPREQMKLWEKLLEIDDFPELQAEIARTYRGKKSPRIAVLVNQVARPKKIKDPKREEAEDKAEDESAEKGRPLWIGFDIIEGRRAAEAVDTSEKRISAIQVEQDIYSLLRSLGYRQLVDARTVRDSLMKKVDRSSEILRDHELAALLRQSDDYDLVFHAIGDFRRGPSGKAIYSYSLKCVRVSDGAHLGGANWDSERGFGDSAGRGRRETMARELAARTVAELQTSWADPSLLSIHLTNVRDQEDVYTVRDFLRNRELFPDVEAVNFREFNAGKETGIGILGVSYKKQQGDFVDRIRENRKRGLPFRLSATTTDRSTVSLEVDHGLLDRLKK